MVVVVARHLQLLPASDRRSFARSLRMCSCGGGGERWVEGGGGEGVEEVGVKVGVRRVRAGSTCHRSLSFSFARSAPGAAFSLSFASAARRSGSTRLRRLERLARRAQLAVALLLARAHQRVRVAEQRELAHITHHLLVRRRRRRRRRRRLRSASFAVPPGAAASTPRADPSRCTSSVSLFCVRAVPCPDASPRAAPSRRRRRPGRGGAGGGASACSV